MHVQLHVQIKHSLAHLQDLGWCYHLYILVGLNLVDVLENALFVHAFVLMSELTGTG